MALHGSKGDILFPRKENIPLIRSPAGTQGMWCSAGGTAISPRTARTLGVFPCKAYAQTPSGPHRPGNNILIAHDAADAQRGEQKTEL